MDITHLKSFITLTELLNFRQTAFRLNLSQSTVSRHIEELEKSLGVTLFRRNNRNVVLSEEGAAFLPFALDILNTAENAEHVVQQFRKGASGHLYLSALAPCASVVTKALDVFFHRYPNIVVDVALQTATDQKSALSEKRYDIHFMNYSMLPSEPGWAWKETHKDKLALVVKKNHPAAGKPLDFNTLKEERFIISQEPYNSDLYRQIMHICSVHNYVPNIVNRYDKLESVLLAVSAGLGISILPASFPSLLFSDSVDVVPIHDVDTNRTYIAAWRTGSTNYAINRFLDCLTED